MGQAIFVTSSYQKFEPKIRIFDKITSPKKLDNLLMSMNVSSIGKPRIKLSGRGPPNPSDARSIKLDNESSIANISSED
jgi:hypothetical protein